ncbi:hypothetical protein P7K49_014767 [Saguinus oedipus]|uniref:RRM domain-containing protein n=1 Tax=Saguinus oedipus TaxID=9490 RepID=A0ABQ9V7B5_SAGOE|nr:hypothetical protein P7K49_014767 [Saguinus oedipus]
MPFLVIFKAPCTDSHGPSRQPSLCPGLVAHIDLDETATEALREFNEQGVLSVLQQFRESDLSLAQDESALLCGVMKQAERETGEQSSGVQPGIGTEVFVSKIQRDLNEDELVLLFEKANPIWDLRLMTDSLFGQNRGYAFITFCGKEAAKEALKLPFKQLPFDGYEIHPGKQLGVCISLANNRIFVGSIPKNKTKENILKEFSKVTEGLVDVILYHQPDDKKKKWGFCFLECEEHKSAAQARCQLMSGKVKVWGNVVTVEWVYPVKNQIQKPWERNLGTEEILGKSSSEFGKLERVNKLKDYAFVHVEDREAAVKAMDETNGKEIEGEELEIILAKPPDKKRKECQAARQASKSNAYEDYYYYPPPRMLPPIKGQDCGQGRDGYGFFLITMA